MDGRADCDVGPLCAAIAAFVGSMLLPCPATFAEGYKPPTTRRRFDAAPTTWTRLPTKSRTSTPFNTYVCPSSSSVKAFFDVGLAATQPSWVTVVGFGFVLGV